MPPWRMCLLGRDVANLGKQTPRGQAQDYSHVRTLSGPRSNEVQYRNRPYTARNLHPCTIHLHGDKLVATSRMRIYTLSYRSNRRCVVLLCQVDLHSRIPVTRRITGPIAVELTLLVPISFPESGKSFAALSSVLTTKSWVRYERRRRVPNSLKIHPAPR